MKASTRWIVLFSLVLIVPLLFVANVWQSYRYVRLEQSLESIQDTHLRLLEENKRLIVGIAGLRSPARIRDIAENELGLAPVPSDRIRRIEIDGGIRGQ